MENTETRVWLDFALACQYLNKESWQNFDEKAIEVGKPLNHMIENPEKYTRNKKQQQSVVN
jgi:hypothetical protein